MSRPAPPTGASRRSPRRRLRMGTFLGIPVPLILLAIILSAMIGLVVASALHASRQSIAGGVVSSFDGTGSVGKNSEGLPVITEGSLGTEVQRLVDTGTIQPMTSFDASSCLREQGISDSVLIMEEIAWGSEETPTWLLVHGPMDRETLRATGGAVSATVVKPSCGTGEQDVPAEDRLWSGDVMVGSL